MPYCTKCGAKVEEGDKFCSACGTSVVRTFREEISISADNLIKKVKELLHEGNVTRIIVKNEEGKTQKQKYMNMVENFSENMTRNIKWSMTIRSAKPVTLIYICLITGPHLYSVRYPKGREIRLEPTDYKKGLGIVDAYPKIHDKLEKCIEFIEFIKNWTIS